MDQCRRVHEREVYKSDFGTLFDDDVLWPSGRTGSHLRLRMGNGAPGVVIVPRHGERLGLVRVPRYPIDAYQWGFPRGFAHDADPLVTARAELSEEMGLSGRFSLIGWFTPDSGVQEMKVAVVCADVDSIDGSIKDSDEVLETTWITPSELLVKLGTDEWEDGMTMAAFILLYKFSAIPSCNQFTAL